MGLLVRICNLLEIVEESGIAGCDIGVAGALWRIISASLRQPAPDSLDQGRPKQAR